MMHHVKMKISLKSKYDYRLKFWIPVKITGYLITGSMLYSTSLVNRVVPVLKKQALQKDL